MTSLRLASAQKSSVRGLHDLFEQQVEATPEAVALIDGEIELSYRELDRRANQMAHHLRELGVRREELVALFCRRSAEAIVSMLGILKAGAAYVPLDELWPRERIDAILTEANIGLVVCDQSLQDRVTESPNRDIIVLGNSGLCQTLETYPHDTPYRDDGFSDLCYVIYTSGSTGRPKGIMTEHGNVVAFASSFRDRCAMTSQDRVYQGFSLTFDGSVEEIWMAFSSGATLIMGPPHLARLGEESAAFMREHGVTFFSTVPSFLNMIQTDIPSLRLVIVSGEPCPKELIRRWVRPGRQMLNVYGPTEATVNSTAWECREEEPVQIGEPLSGYTTHILDSEGSPVQRGETGELFIGGVGVARGYLNQPELSQQRFLPNSLDDSPRLYRTGDLVREGEGGELFFLGRMDAQVKVRGYRVELAEVEAALGELDGIQGTAARVVEGSGTQQLAAWVALEPGAEELERGEVLESLRQRLPPYMVPAYLDVIDEIPRLTSGKIDRKALPEPKSRLTAEREIVAPRNDKERLIESVWAELFQVDAVSIDDDFFLGLGGDSLLAVEAASRLRGVLDETLSVRDIYRCPTIRQLGRHVPETSPTPTSSEPPRTTVSVKAKRRCHVLQAASLYVLYGIPMVIVVLLVEVYGGVVSGGLSTKIAWTALGLSFVFAYPFFLTLGILAKWTLIGKYKRGRHPLWGWYYFRWWLVTRLVRMSGPGLLAGTSLMNIYLRLMGARIGAGCVLNTAHFSSFDLLRVGDRSCIGSESQLLGYHVEGGELHIGPVEVGADCYVGIQSCLAVRSRMEDGAGLDDLSLLAEGQTLSAGERWRGSPAQPAKVTLAEVPREQRPSRRSVLMGCLSVLAVYSVQLFMLAASLPSLYLLHVAYTVSSYWVWGAVLLAAVPLFEVCFWALQIVVKACVLRRAKPGVYPVESVYYLRKWFVDSLLSMSRMFTLPVYTTLYLPPLLRMLGAKIGARAELSVIVQMSPDLLEMGRESFFADGSIMGGLRLHQGHFELARNRIGRRSFIGNSAVLPVGASVGDECLLGVLSVPPDPTTPVPNGTEWLGAPPFALPHRRRVGEFTDQETFEPPLELFVARLFVDAFRILSAGAVEIVGVIAALAYAFGARDSLPLWQTLLVAPIVGLATAALMVLCVVGMKRLLFPTYRPTIRPLWTPYVWFNEVVNGLHESVAGPVLSPMLGTPFFAPYLRLMGCKIGKDCFFDTTLFGEFDLVTLGDRVALNSDVVIQNHLFEDRVFKSSHLSIGDDCTVGNMSVVLYNSKLEEGCAVAPLSLVMKGESVPRQTRWEGIPIERQIGCGERG